MIEDLKGNFWEDLLIHLRLGRTYESKVAKEVNVTYSHVVKNCCKVSFSWDDRIRKIR